MQKISLELSNCYGIGSLREEFDFSQGRVHSVYAPNGVMKTSFAKVMRDLAAGNSPSDLMFPSRPTQYSVQVDGAPISPEQLIVIEPYVKDYESKQVSTLLVDATLKARYESAVTAVDQSKKLFLDALKVRSGLNGKKVTPEGELRVAFGLQDLLTGLGSLRRAANEGDAALADLRYDLIFDERATKFLSSPDVLRQLAQYLERYEALVSQSPILTARFNHTSATSVHKSLADASFFEANHWITLSNGVEIRAAAELKQRVEDELARVNADATLKRAFQDFDKKISANEELRQLREYVRERPTLLPLLADLAGLKRRVWGAWLQAESALLAAVEAQYAQSRAVIEEVMQAANDQATDWAAVVEKFNRRFFVPFRLRVENQADVILKSVAPRVAFEFKDEADSRVIEVDALRDTLSQGERRALYLLNVLFELRVLEKANNPVLVVVDDIADSFDYRNKYAIIEYLHEVADPAGPFRMIVLTHNFDFHRSVSGRLGVRRQNRRLAVRSGRDVRLAAEVIQRKTPVQYWLEDKPNDPEAFLATIPFVRNLAEYTGHGNVETALTELLHVKGATKTWTLADIDANYASLIRNYQAPAQPSRTDRYWDVLQRAVIAILARPGPHAGLESKVVLSIAVRLSAEEHMIFKLADPNLTFMRNQTQGLVNTYRARFPLEHAALAVLDRVQLMTPETIHANSFMYEPILDLGIEHLKQLHADVEALPR